MGRTAQSKTSNDHGDESAYVNGQDSLSSRMVFLTGEVNETTIANVNAALMMCASQSSDPITLVISTYGGSCHEMFSLYDTMQYIDCDVNTVGIGKIMSAGVLLLAAGKKGSRLVGKHATVMVHPLSSFHGGNIFQLEAETKESSRLQNQMVEALAEETGMSRIKVKKIMGTGHDVYLDAERCVQLGIADKVMLPKQKTFKSDKKAV